MIACNGELYNKQQLLHDALRKIDVLEKNSAPTSANTRNSKRLRNIATDSLNEDWNDESEPNADEDLQNAQLFSALKEYFQAQFDIMNKALKN